MRQRGELLFALPPRKGFKAVTVNGKRVRAKVVAKGVVAVRLVLDERAVVELEW